MSIGDNIRRTRKSQHMTQVCLAARAGLVQGLVSQYETGKVIPKSENLNSLADALGVSVAVLDESLLGVSANQFQHENAEEAVASYIERVKKAVMGSDIPADSRVKIWDILEQEREG